MRALVVSPAAPGRRAIRDVPDPTPKPNEVLVRVEATSLNRGEVGRAQSAAEGLVLGWDAAGRVVRAAAEGHGPAVGRRVVTQGPAGG